MRTPMKALFFPTLAAVALGLTATGAAVAQPDLTIVSWGGAYTRSQMLAFIDPYREASGGWINVDDYSGGLDQIRAQVESLNVEWDVVDMHIEDVLRGCNEGLLEKIDHAILAPAPNGTPARQDFLPGTLPECAVGTMVFATVIAYDGNRFEKNPPSRLRDLFNLPKYPGRRALRRSPKGILEWALLADGVPQDRIYTTLSRPAGLQRAFAKLDTIKKQIIWWRSPREAAQLLVDGDVVIAAAPNGSIFQANARRGTNLVIVWDGQLWEYDMWVIPKGNRRLERALQFIRFATTTERLAAQANHIPDGPTRRSSTALVSEQMRPNLPTALENTENFLRIDNAWWAQHHRRIEREFAIWLAQDSGLIDGFGTPDFPGGLFRRR